jgi:hypothetical protein
MESEELACFPSHTTRKTFVPDFRQITRIGTPTRTEISFVPEMEQNAENGRKGT